MKTSDKFAPLEQVDPVAAKRLPPGVTMLVSKRTFAQIAAERYEQCHPDQSTTSLWDNQG